MRQLPNPVALVVAAILIGAVSGSCRTASEARAGIVAVATQPAAAAPSTQPAPFVTPIPSRQDARNCGLVAQGLLRQTMTQLVGTEPDVECFLAEREAARQVLDSAQQPLTSVARALQLLLLDNAVSLMDATNAVNRLLAANPSQCPELTDMVLLPGGDLLQAVVVIANESGPRQGPAVRLMMTAAKRDGRFLDWLRDVAARPHRESRDVGIGAVTLLDRLTTGPNAFPLPDGTIRVWEDDVVSGPSDVGAAAIKVLIRRHESGLIDSDSEWVRNLFVMASGEQDNRVVAIRRLTLHLKNPLVLKKMLRALTDRDETIVLAAARAVRDGGVGGDAAAELVRFVLLHDHSENVAFAAAAKYCISALVAAVPAIDSQAFEVVGMLANPATREDGACILAAMGKGVVPALQFAYAKAWDDADARNAIVDVLGSTEMAGRDVEGTLMIALQFDADPATRLAAARGLKWARNNLPRVRTTLQQAMQSPDDGLRVAATLSLAEIGPGPELKAEELLPVLISRGTDERFAVTRLLGSMGDRAAPAIPTLIAMIDNVHPSLRVGAAQALVKMDPSGKRVGPAIVAAVMHKDRVTLGILLPFVKLETTKRLSDQLRDIASKDPEPSIREAAVEADHHLGN